MHCILQARTKPNDRISLRSLLYLSFFFLHGDWRDMLYHTAKYICIEDMRANMIRITLFMLIAHQLHRHQLYFLVTFEQFTHTYCTGAATDTIKNISQDFYIWYDFFSVLNVHRPKMSWFILLLYYLFMVSLFSNNLPLFRNIYLLL